MKLKSFICTAAIAALVFFQAANTHASPPVRTNLFSTGFEYLEGFDPEFFLGDQNGWRDYPIYNGELVLDLPFDGIVSNRFENLGQQGWIGGIFEEPMDQVQVWHPVIIDPIPTATPIIKFGVLMAIDRSSDVNDDYFRWSVYNSETNRLFSIDIFSGDGSIFYQLDNEEFTDSGFFIAPGGATQNLEISMHFAANTWSAWLDSVQIVTDAPITTAGQKRTLGDIRAIWLPFDPLLPGDNWMVFDNYSVYAESVPTEPIQPTLSTLGRTTEGFYALRLTGENACTYVLDYSDDSSTWFPMKTNIAYDGSFDYVDTNAPVLPQRIFRARLLSE